MVVVRTKMGDKRNRRIRVGSLTRKKHTATDRQTDDGHQAGRARQDCRSPRPLAATPAAEGGPWCPGVPPQSGCPPETPYNPPHTAPPHTPPPPPAHPPPPSRRSGEGMPLPRGFPLLSPRDGKRRPAGRPGRGENGHGTGDQRAIPPSVPRRPPSPPPPQLQLQPRVSGVPV